MEKILNLNTEPKRDDQENQDGAGAHNIPILNPEGEPVWKVLVFDTLGRDVISSVLRVNDLRAWGITIHLYVSK